MLNEANGGGEGQVPVVLDVRNGYEWDAGHFQGAARPLEVWGGGVWRGVSYIVVCVCVCVV